MNNINSITIMKITNTKSLDLQVSNSEQQEIKQRKIECGRIDMEVNLLFVYR